MFCGVVGVGGWASPEAAGMVVCAAARLISETSVKEERIIVLLILSGRELN